MVTWISIYLMIGFYFAFITFISMEESGINGDFILLNLPRKFSDYLYSHPYLIKLFFLFVGIALCVFWPYILFKIWKDNKYEW